MKLKYFFSIRNVLGTVFVFVFMWLVSLIGVEVEFLNVFEQVFEDFKLTDIYYTKIRKPQDAPFEKEVVLVNLGAASLGRRTLAQQINVLSAYNPKVIGIDARFFYPNENDPIGDFQLMQAFKNAGNVIVGSEASTHEIVTNENNKSAWDTLLLPADIFKPFVQTGHVNTGLPYGDFVTWRDFPIVEKIQNGHQEPSLAAKILENYDPEAYKALMARVPKEEDKHEPIYFKGNLDKYLKLDVEQVLDTAFTKEMIEGKIVLMGYLGGEYTDTFWDDDKFYTPLNPQSIGRGYPDMYGVVVHANILSMALEGKFIRELSAHWSIIIAVVLCFFNVAVFSAIATNHSLAVWYNAISKLIQLVEAVILVLINLFLFAELNYQVDLTVSLFVIILSGDLTEIWVDVILNSYRKFFKR